MTDDRNSRSAQPAAGAAGAARLVEASGPWPFISRRVFRHPDHSRRVWLSRAHRKGLPTGGGPRFHPPAAGWLWSPGDLNWWIGTIFALGASLFALGCVLSLAPALASWLELDSRAVNAVYFAGSIPFTTAAYLQLYQAANAPAAAPSAPGRHRRRLLGWKPGDIGWVSCALQFPGTVLFNFNTFDAMVAGLNWWQQELEIWAPDIVGSILFLASGYLAFVETCHRHLAWRPRDLSWWVTFSNLLGCVGFMIAAVFAVVLPGTVNQAWVSLSVVFTLVGALCFFTGSLLMLPESAVASPAEPA